MPATNHGKLDEVRYEMCWVFIDGYEAGWTSGGINITGSSDTTGIEVDQETDPIITLTTSSTTDISVPLTQWNLRNLQTVFHGAEIRTTGTGQDRREYLAVGSGGTSKTHTLRLHPKDRDDDDHSADISFPAVTVASDLDISIAKGELQILNVTFSVSPGNPPVAERPGDRIYINQMPAGMRVAVTGVTVAPTTLAMSVDEIRQLTVTVEPENATVKNYTWTSSDEAVAVVDENGTVYAVGTGMGTIAATTKEGSFIGTSAVTVS